ncbi:DNA-directed RNA polymerase specialized sigma subunit, sigma24 family [Streptomyces sp. DvalAA-14]|nr:DNA-directed RNA polymerase specialized sigma subunit, sigma24 family [Streptomyces sp. DvalAA-14]
MPATRSAARGRPGSRSTPHPHTPEAAFDALYLHTAGALLRQIEVLTGDPSFAPHAVAHAFDQAWQRWPEVARDSDPVGWVRAAAHAYALAPWQRWTPGPHPEPRSPQDPLAAALLELPAAHRRVLLLHDGLGLGLPRAAAEVEASSHAAAARLARAREALTEAVPALDDLPARLGRLLQPDDSRPEFPEFPHLPAPSESGAPGAASGSASASALELGPEAGLGQAPEPEPEPGPHPDPDPDPADLPAALRSASERTARRRTVGAFLLTGLIATLTTVTIALSPSHGTHPQRFHPDVPAASKPIRDRGPEGSRPPPAPVPPGAPGAGQRSGPAPHRGGTGPRTSKR